MRIYSSIFILLLSFAVQAQEKKQFELAVYTFSGTAILQQQDEVDQNSFIKNSGRAEFSILWNNFGVYTGIGSYTLTSNQVKEGENSLLKNQHLFIPFGVSYKISLLTKEESTKLGLQLNLGGYAGNLYKTKLTTRNENVSETNLGWNFGIDGRLGLFYNLYQNFDIKIGLQTMTDISKVEHQKTTQNHSYFVGVGYRF